jgi:hypothetical protein
MSQEQSQDLTHKPDVWVGGCYEEKKAVSLAKQNSKKFDSGNYNSASFKKTTTNEDWLGGGSSYTSPRKGGKQPIKIEGASPIKNNPFLSK